MKYKINLLTYSALLLILSPVVALALTVEISATVPGCGDDIIGVGEQCDGSNLGGSSCSSLGFSGGGTLSCSGACTFITTSCNAGGGGGGGSGGGSSGGGSSGSSIPDTNVVFTGRAYPLSRVGILKDGQLVVTTIAGPDSNFSATISSLSTGNYNFSVYGEDSNGRRSSPFTFPIYITSGVTTKISGIFITPTIAVDKEVVKQGDNISIFGQSTPSAEITISVNSPQEFFVKNVSDSSGAYLINFDSSVLDMGNHSTKSKAAKDGEISQFSKTLAFRVGTENVLFDSNTEEYMKGDLNDDKRVNLVDFSIAAFWYKKPLSSQFSSAESLHLNADGKVDLVDFSIMAYNWTG